MSDKKDLVQSFLYDITRAKTHDNAHRMLMEFIEKNVKCVDLLAGSSFGSEHEKHKQKAAKDGCVYVYRFNGKTVAISEYSDHDEKWNKFCNSDEEK